MKFYTLNNKFVKECKNVPRDFTGFGVSVTGTLYWYLDSRLHRIDGPAIEFDDGFKCWYINGLLHREDGPAVEYSDGTKEWYVFGKEVPQEQHTLYVDILKLKGLLPNI